MPRIAPLLGRIRSAIGDRFWTATRPKIDRVVYANGGVGDELILTAIAHAARGAGRPLHILTERPEIWRGNRDPLSVQIGVERWWYAHRRGWLHTEIVHLVYETKLPSHIAAQMAARAGVDLPADWRPILHVDRSLVPKPGRIVIQNSCRGAKYAADTKEWPQVRWLELVKKLAPDFELVQIGTSADPPLPHARDLRGRTNLHEAAAEIGGAACFVGLESGLMHIAAATSAPAVIVYGGRSFPSGTGYRWHTHITRQPPCAGCGLNSGCPHHLVCLDIPVDEVEAAVRRVVAAPTP